jgi:hypothetical protein
MTSNKFIIKTLEEVKVLTINDLKSNLYSLQHLFDNEDRLNKTDSLALETSESHIIISAVQNEWVNGKIKRSIQVLIKTISEI